MPADTEAASPPGARMNCAVLDLFITLIARYVTACVPGTVGASCSEIYNAELRVSTMFILPIVNHHDYKLSDKASIIFYHVTSAITDRCLTSHKMAIRCWHGATLTTVTANDVYAGRTDQP